jgi:hypothetical protein
MTIGRGAREGEKTRSEAQQRLNVPAVSHYSGIGKWAATSLTALIRGSFKPEKLRSSTDSLCMSVGDLPSPDQNGCSLQSSLVLGSMGSFQRFGAPSVLSQRLSGGVGFVSSILTFNNPQIDSFGRHLWPGVHRLASDWVRFVDFDVRISGLSASMRLALGSFVAYRDRVTWRLVRSANFIWVVLPFAFHLRPAPLVCAPRTPPARPDALYL